MAILKSNSSYTADSPEGSQKKPIICLVVLSIQMYSEETLHLLHSLVSSCLQPSSQVLALVRLYAQGNTTRHISQRQIQYCINAAQNTLEHSYLSQVSFKADWCLSATCDHPGSRKMVFSHLHSLSVFAQLVLICPLCTITVCLLSKFSAESYMVVAPVLQSL